MYLAKSSWRPIVKTLNLKVWTLPLIFLHDSTLFVIDMHQKMTISLVSTQFILFHFHPLAGLNCYPHPISCLRKEVETLEYTKKTQDHPKSSERQPLNILFVKTTINCTCYLALYFLVDKTTNCRLALLVFECNSVGRPLLLPVTCWHLSTPWHRFGSHAGKNTKIQDTKILRYFYANCTQNLTWV